MPGVSGFEPVIGVPMCLVLGIRVESHVVSHVVTFNLRRVDAMSSWKKVVDTVDEFHLLLSVALSAL